ncbi:MAG: hypothetical protein ACKVTZ_15435 [Bacteroidia bacterium]
MSTESKLKSFQNLLVVAAADDSLDAEEKEVLIEIGTDMGLTPAELKPIISAENLEFVLHDNYEENEADLGDMLTIAAADGVVYDSEFAICENFAKAAGISESKLKELLELALTYADEWEEDDEDEAA